MALGPLGQAPLLRNRRRLLQLRVLAADVAAKELKLAAGARTLEDFWRGAGEGCNAGGVCENAVEGGSVAAELLLVTQVGHVDCFAVVGGGGGGGVGGRGGLVALLGDGGTRVHGGWLPFSCIA